MANEEHVKILKSGVEKWNQWRRANFHIVPVLDRASLRQAELGGINLSGVHLRNAELCGAFLGKANFNACLSG